MKQIYKENNYYLLNHNFVEIIKLGRRLKIRHFTPDFIIIQHSLNQNTKKLLMFKDYYLSIQVIISFEFRKFSQRFLF
jgi:hypothetical protein